MKKKIIYFIIILFAATGCSSVQGLPFASQKSHKTVKYQKKSDIKRVANGGSYYTRKNGKMRKL